MSTKSASPIIIGIDLGTTNTALAHVDARALENGIPASPSIFNILQLARAGDARELPTLPSFLYLAEPGEFPAESLDLPWAPARRFMVGAGAKDRGAEVPLRLVSSAKSWLCHPGVDRMAPILPHQAPDDVARISPVAATTRYLEHLRDAWDHACAEPPFVEQSIFLTVPASFDAVARDLTLAAARSAGLLDITLLEEPQAAFYAWLARVGDRWRDLLKPNDRVLVCDIGGGTSDFSLIGVADDGHGNLSLERLAVGEHILLGGDNMDLALAHSLMQKFARDGKKLDASQQRALISAARRAKELLLSTSEHTAVPITVLGRGSKLIGGTLSTTLERSDVEAILVDGFFPRCDRSARPSTAKRTGFMELGLPFESDPAITRHLARFLETHGGGARPTHILFNGGVFNSALLRDRLHEVIATWCDTAPVILEESDYDLAVARGAAHYGAMRRSGGIRIRGGVARSYYVGIESAMPAVPGVAPPIRALCVVPFGMEEGTETRVPRTELGLVVGEKATFRFLSSTTRTSDAVGDVLDEFTWPDALTETAPIETTVEVEGVTPGTLLPVRLIARVTEVGTVEVWSVTHDDAHRFRLEFDIRERRE